MMVIGDIEMESQSVSLRAYGERNSETYSNQELEAKFTDLNADKMPKELR